LFHIFPKVWVEDEGSETFAQSFNFFVTTALRRWWWWSWEFATNFL